MRFRGADPEDRAAASAPDVEPLTATLVRYAERPDRVTIYPDETDRVERMATWLSADAEAFVGLDEVR